MVPSMHTRHLVAAPVEPCSLRGRASATFFGLLLIGLLAGCGSGGGSSSGGGTTAPTTATQVVGLAGGTVSLPAGKVSLTIPPGALSADTPITVTAMSSAGSPGPVYQFGPSGLIFNLPVTVTLSVDPSLLPPGTAVQDLILSYVDDYLEILTDVQIDIANSTITGKATHFSGFGLATSTAVINELGRAINTSDIPTATSFRMPIGNDGVSDFGEDLVRLDVSGTWSVLDYPKRSFNITGSSNRWFVTTAFNNNRFLNHGWRDPSPPSLAAEDQACKISSIIPSQYSLYSCKGSYHPGEDWGLEGGGNLGKPIHAIADGIVLLNQRQNVQVRDENGVWTGAWTSTGTFGNILIIGHKFINGQGDVEMIASVYAHMVEPSELPTYAVGRLVRQGAEIGRIGGTGGVEPHLHFEIAKPQVYNPDVPSTQLDGTSFKIDADGTIKIPIRPGDPLKNDLTVQGWRWPGPNSSFINASYYEPSKFIKNFHTFTLAIAKQGTGTGTVTSSGGGINCGTVCTSQPITGGDSVVLTAASGNGSTFTGWSGGGCSGTGTCTVTMTANQTVTATFSGSFAPVDGTGTWQGTYTDSFETIPHLITMNITQTGTNVSGSWAALFVSNGGGTASGTFTGTFTSGSVMTFVRSQTQTSLGPCPGSFSNTATVSANSISGTYSGSDCLGFHSNGQVSLTKQAAPPPPSQGITVSISVVPNRVVRGGTTTVSWNAANVDSCTITRNGIPWKPTLPADASNVVSGFDSDTINGQTTYILTCTNNAGASLTAEQIVNVPPIFGAF